mgnify:CR=1 FL=1
MRETNKIEAGINNDQNETRNIRKDRSRSLVRIRKGLTGLDRILIGSDEI